MKVVIPLKAKEIKMNGVNKYIERIKECGCTDVAVTFRNTISFESATEECKEIGEICSKFNEAGINTAIWIHPTLDLVPFKKYTNLTPLKEAPINGKNCPMDDEYCNDVAYFVELVARYTKTKKIILEDDFRMQFPYLSHTCFCEHHLKFYSEYIGKTVTKEEMGEKIFAKPDIYREAYVKGLQEGLNKLARAIREGADRVSEDIILSFSAGPANCGADGTDMFEMIDILKGKNDKADIRLSGGPYWQKGFNLIRNMMTAVDLERYTALKCKEKGIIGRAEGDVFPRPRHIVPASHLEIFHTALLFDGACEEILKYMLDYTASSDYEKGYTNAHIKNMPIYEKIKELREGKENTGFYPVEDFSLQSYTHNLNPIPENEVFISCVRNFCAENSLPVSHTPGGVNILFGDRARKFDLSLLKNGSVIDIVAAKILMEKGIDVGIEKIEDRVFKGGREYFPNEKENVGIARSFDTSFITLNKGAETLSYFVPNNHDVVYHNVSDGILCSENEDIVSMYTYENADGHKFMVLNFDASQCHTLRASQGVFNNYCRQRLIEEKYSWLHGEKLDAFCAGHPNLYMIVKKNDKGIVVGMWNHFDDDIDMPVVNLGDTYKKANFINCDGKIENDKVVITSGLGAYKFCFIELIK